MILLTDPNGNTQKFKSVSQAAFFLGRNESAIYRSLKRGYNASHRNTGINYKASYGRN